MIIPLTVLPPEHWAKRLTPIDVLARRQKVLDNVSRDGKRKIYKIEAAKGFSGGKAKKAACLYVSGCSYSCQYCFVNPQSLTGIKGDYCSPQEAFEKLRRIVVQTQNPHVQFNGGEVFLTPDWTLELIRLLCEFFEKDCQFASKSRGIIWCDTMGFDLMRESQLFEALVPYKKHVAIFLSTKGHPDDYELVARAPREFADDAFLVLEKAWQHGLVAMPEALDRIFWPQRMDWYIERLQGIHPNAPRVLHIDKYSPVNRVKWAPNKKMKVIGGRPNKSDPERNMPLREEVITEWQNRLGKIYGPKGAKPHYDGIDSPTFDCDLYPDESFYLVEKLILNSR